MYITDWIWWIYSTFAATIAIFLVWFTIRIRHKGA
jgi:hypothetical protein